MYMILIMMSGSFGWAFQVAATINKRPSCFKSSGPEDHRIGPKIDQIAYFFIIFLYDYVCSVCI